MVDANERCDLAGAKQLLLLARDHDVVDVVWLQFVGNLLKTNSASYNARFEYTLE